MDTITDIAKYCEERARVKHTVSKDSMQIEKYKSTLFVAISHDNNVTCSYTPHVLSEAEQCILIRKGSTVDRLFGAKGPAVGTTGQDHQRTGSHKKVLGAGNCCIQEHLG